jgi:hypothetical protein
MSLRLKHIEDRQAAGAKFRRLDSLIVHDERDPYYPFPPNRGYLSRGGLLRDLSALLGLLQCYKKHGVREVIVGYM